MRILFSSLFLLCPCFSTADEVWEIPYLSTPDWEKAAVRTHFFFPWKDAPAPPTTLRMFHDGKTLFFRYDVTDSDIVLVDSREKMSVIGDDRAEIFLATPDLKDWYYGFEMAPNGVMLDYRMKYYRQADRDWSGDFVKFTGTLTETGYIIDGTIDLAAMKSRNILQDDGTFYAGFFRAEFSHLPNGEILEEWISWKHSGTPEPDFHVPGAFGKVRLMFYHEKKPL
ncbi:MAG: carbohydrate-binding family 9-like protein [Planctomycetia bacterium]|nr:carbohydrate-binding family 9-like protein [Planctomycetia bacterium]